MLMFVSITSEIPPLMRRYTTTGGGKLPKGHGGEYGRCGRTRIFRTTCLREGRLSERRNVTTGCFSFKLLTFALRTSICIQDTGRFALRRIAERKGEGTPLWRPEPMEELVPHVNENAEAGAPPCCSLMLDQ